MKNMKNVGMHTATKIKDHPYAMKIADLVSDILFDRIIDGYFDKKYTWLEIDMGINDEAKKAINLICNSIIGETFDIPHKEMIRERATMYLLSKMVHKLETVMNTGFVFIPMYFENLKLSKELIRIFGGTWVDDLTQTQQDSLFTDMAFNEKLGEMSSDDERVCIPTNKSRKAFDTDLRNVVLIDISQYRPHDADTSLIEDLAEELTDAGIDFKFPDEIYHDSHIDDE